ncbi:hypothetical protein [Natrinema thermotolerans]
MSAQQIPTEWSKDGSNSWSHSRLPVKIELTSIGKEWDVEVTPLPDDMPWHSLRVNIRKQDESQEREVAATYMNEFSDIEMEIRKDYPDFSEERTVLLVSTEAVLNLRK